MALTIAEFVARWQRSTLSERAATQPHFIDLCEILGERSPTEADQKGSTYTFEKGVMKTSGGDGFADVWMRGHFAWEYKGKHKDLGAAYQQLLQYREHLDNPRFQKYQADQSQTDVLETLLTYNREDCLAMKYVEGWLRTL
jgi:hypothetical protein